MTDAVLFFGLFLLVALAYWRLSVWTGKNNARRAAEAERLADEHDAIMYGIDGDRGRP